MSWVTGHAWFWPAAMFLAGLTAGAWIERFSVRERPRKLPPQTVL